MDSSCRIAAAGRSPGTARLCLSPRVSTWLFFARSCCIATTWIFFLACPAWAAWPDDYDPQYVQAVENTSGTVPNDVVRQSSHLAHLGDGRMEWSGEQLVMTMLTDFASYDRHYTDSRYRPEVWVAPVAETVEFFRTSVGQADDLEVCYRQYMGMPATHSDDRIVELLIHPDMLFRPAEDTRIDSSSLGPTRDTSQYDKATLAYPTFDQWWANQMHTYDADSNPPYPWTRLGYTYDWGGSPDQIVGSTEFIVKRWGTGSTWLRDAAGNWYQTDFSVTEAQYALAVRAVVPTTAYLYFVRSGADVGDFLVAGDCTAIWAGDRFTPVASASPLVDIAAGATVASGILIDDSDTTRTFQLTNRGSILGALYGPDKLLRACTIEFCSPVRFDNLGLVSAPSLAVYAVAAPGPVILQNRGTLIGGQTAAMLGEFDDVFLNAGTVHGDIAMGDGDDTVRLLGGEIQGNIDGGNDEDRLTVQAEEPVRVAGIIFGFEHVLVSRARDSSDAPFVLNGELNGNLLLGSSGEDFAPGRLAGNFAIYGSVNTESGASVAPGSSLGTGLIAGNYTQTAGAALEMEIARTADNQLVSDTLAVTGAAHLADGAEVHVLRQPEQSRLPLRQGDSFVLLEAGLLDLAAEPVCRSESDVLDFQCAASGNDLLLVVAQVHGFADLAVGERNTAMAAALDADLATAGGSYASLLAEMQFANADTINDTLDLVRPDAYQALTRAVRLVTWSIHEELAESAAPGCGAGTRMPRCVESSGGGSTGNRQGEIRFSLQPFGLVHYEGPSPTTIGYAAESAGFLLGANRQLSDRLAAGVVFACADVGVDLQRGIGSVDFYRIGPYATFDLENWRLHGAATFGRHRYDALRSAASLGSYAADYSASDGCLYLDLRRPGRGTGWNLAPLGSLQYTFGRREALAETLTGPAALALDACDSDSLRSRVGASIGRTIGSPQLAICPTVLAGWAHEFLSDQPSGARFRGGTSGFVPPTSTFLEDAAFLRGGLSVCRSDRLETALAYDGQWGAHTVAHAASLSVTGRF